MALTLDDIMFEDEQLDWNGSRKKQEIIGSHIMDRLLEENNPWTTTSFWVGFGNMTDSQFSRFAYRLKSYRVLTEISFRGISLNKKRMRELCEALHFIPKIEKLSFVDCNMDDDMLFSLSKVINNYTDLKELYIYETWYDINAENISKNLRLLHLSPYMELIYAGSELTNKGMKYLFDSLINCKKLEILAIAGNVVNSENGIIDKFVNCLSDMSEISTLAIILKGLDTVGLKNISNVLPQLNHLKSLIINAGHCEEEACICLADNISKCNQIMNLFLDIPTFGYKPADRLGEAFMKLKSLESFYLNTFKLNDMGFRHMMYNIPELIELNTLILLIDDVGDGGITDLGKVIGNLYKLQYLHIRSYNVSDEGISILGEHMITNINLRSFTLDSPLVSDRGIKSIAKGLSLCKNLQMFSMISEEVTDTGMSILAQTLEKCNLQILYIENPKLTDVSSELLIKVLENSKNDVCGIGMRIPQMKYKLLKKLLLEIPTKYPHLNQIDIMSINFDDSLCEILGNDLTQMKEIQYFTLSGNLIGDEGSSIITNSLIHHPIRTFCINGAEMSDKCVEPLLNCIVKWPRLLAIMLHGNYTISAYKRLQNGLKKCPLLHRSDVTSDHYSVVHPSLCSIM